MGGAAYAFVTGGTGFIGSQVVKHLVAGRGDGAWDEVCVLVRSEASAEKARGLGAEPVAGDLMDGAGAWREAARGARYVVHCAQPTGNEFLESRTEQELNLLGALDDAVTARAVFVFGSSYLGSGEGSALMDESVEPHPLGVGRYFEPGITAVEARGRGGLDCVVALPGGVYGMDTWFLKLILHLLAGRHPVLMCDPVPLWPYVHVDDCARALVHLLTVDRAKLDATGRRIIIAGGDPTPMDRFVAAVGNAVGRSPDIQRMPVPELYEKLPALMAQYLTANMPHSGARLRSLGFEARYPTVEEGVASLGLPRFP